MSDLLKAFNNTSLVQEYRKLLIEYNKSIYCTDWHLGNYTNLGDQMANLCKRMEKELHLNEQARKALVEEIQWEYYSKYIGD